MALTKVTADVLGNNSVGHTQLHNRYKNAASITSTSGTINIDWSAAAVYKMEVSLTGATTLNFTGFVKGQVLTIHQLEGAQTVTLTSDAANSSTFYKIGADYDGSSDPNILQVECLDDSVNALFAFTTAAISQSTTL
jgi:hypothetical protein